VKRSRLRAGLASTAVVAVVAGLLTAATTAQAATGCQVTYRVTNQWQGGFGADVTIENLGDPLTGWQLAWTFTAGQTVTQLWNGSVVQAGARTSTASTASSGTLPPSAWAGP
jgi:hypothetical protein